MTWEIWVLSLGDSHILKVLPFGDDELRSQLKFDALQKDAVRDGGHIELRRDGVMVTSFRQSSPKGVS